MSHQSVAVRNSALTWPWNLVLAILSPSPPSVSLDIFVSIGSWFATPLGVDLVSAPCCAWPGGNRRRGGADEPRHCAGREECGWVGLSTIKCFVASSLTTANCDLCRSVVVSSVSSLVRLDLTLSSCLTSVCVCLFWVRLSVVFASVCASSPVRPSSLFGHANAGKNNTRVSPAPPMSGRQSLTEECFSSSKSNLRICNYV